MSSLTYSPSAHTSEILKQEGNKGLRVLAGDVHACYEYGVYFSKKGEFERAYIYLKVAYNLYKGDINVAKAFAKCCAELGKTEEEAAICKANGLKTRQERWEDGDLKEKLIAFWEKYNIKDYSFSQKPLRHLAWFFAIFIAGELPGMIFGMEIGMAIMGVTVFPLYLFLCLLKVKKFIDIKLIGENDKWVKVKNDPYENDPDTKMFRILDGAVSFSNYQKSFLSYNETFTDLSTKEQDFIKDSYANICESVNDKAYHKALLKQATRCNNLMNRYLAGETGVLPVLQYMYDVTYENDKFVNGFEGSLNTYSLNEKM